jgi:flagellar basal-body rod protein FlgG
VLEGLYSAASGLAAQQTRLDAIANDLANASTTGYKPVKVAFADLAYAAPATGSVGEAQTGAGARASFAGRSHLQGALNPTDRPLDVAIQGPGFLRVRRPDGTEALTRNGSLQLDAQGRLTTADGLLVQPAVTAPAGTSASQLSIGADGTVSAAGAPLGRLEVVDVPNPDGLLALGGSLFSATPASGAVRAAEGSTLVGGHLEASGVDMASAMTSMIESQRAFQLVSKAITTRDEVWGIANNIKRV